MSFALRFLATQQNGAATATHAVASCAALALHLPRCLLSSRLGPRLDLHPPMSEATAMASCTLPRKEGEKPSASTSK